MPATITDPKRTSRTASIRPELILFAGLLAGLVDAVYFSASALIQSASPVRVLQSIAAFWLGKASFAGGATSALLGAATHFGLATVMAAVYAVATRRLRAVREMPAVSGPVYGLILYCVMYYIVLPLRWPTLYPRFDRWKSVLDILTHVGVGLAIAFTIGSPKRADANQQETYA